MCPDDRNEDYPENWRDLDDGIDEDRPEPGKQYRLTGGPDDKALSNGNTWTESEVLEV